MPQEKPEASAPPDLPLSVRFSFSYPGAGKLVFVLFLAFITRVLVIPSTFFSDVSAVPYPARFVFHGELDVWKAMERAVGLTLPRTDVITTPYGPLFYYPMAIYLWFLEKVSLLDLAAWRVPGDVVSASALSLFKLPYLVPELGTGFIAARLMRGAAGFNALALWLLSPAVVFVSYVMGQNDAFAVMFIAAALWFAKRHLEDSPQYHLGWLRLSAADLALLMLSFGASIKIYPLLLVPAFAIYLGPNAGAKLRLIALGLLPLVLMSLPFLASGYLDSVVLSGHTGQLSETRLGYVSVFPLLYLALLYWLTRPQRAESFRVLVAAGAIVFLAMFIAVEPYEPQRALALVFMIGLLAAEDPRLLPAYLIVNLYPFALVLWGGWGGLLDAKTLSPLSPLFWTFPAPGERLADLLTFDEAMTYAVTGVAVASGAALWVYMQGASLARRFYHWELLAVAGILPLFLLASAAYGMTGLYGHQPRATQQFVALNGTPAEQRFTATVDHLKAIDIYMSTNNLRYGGSVTLSLRDADSGATVRQATTSLGRTNDRFYRFGFPEVSDSSGHTYVLALVSEPVFSGSPLRLGLAETGGTLSPATSGSQALAGAVQYREVRSMPWGAVRDDVIDSVADHKKVYTGVAAVLLLANVGLYSLLAAQYRRESKERVS